jgi:hypothetical protein
VRTAAYLFLPVGLALLGFGLWLLYARFVGGPEHYMGRPDETTLRDLEDSIAKVKKSRADSEGRVAQLRPHVEKLPADGADGRRAKLEGLLAEHERSMRESDAVLAKAEPLRDKLAQMRDAEMDEARVRTLRRGILFTLVGVIWVTRSVGYLRRTARRTIAPAVGA